MDNIARKQLILEAWGQGFNVGAITLLILVVLCNYRRHVLLHKLILLELLLAIGHGLFIFFQDPAYGWVLSSTATLLYASYNVHSVIAWLKIKPFLPRWGARIFIISIVMVQPYWVVESWANFEYWNKQESDVFRKTRLFEPLMRDPWWVFTTVKLVLVINKNYNFTWLNLIRTSPRFGVMLLCLFLSIIFLITDVAYSALALKQIGMNPFWRFALVFKCASDVIFLDDFKSVLDRISESAFRHLDNIPNGTDEGPTFSSKRQGGTSKRKADARHVVTISGNSNRRTEQQNYGGKMGWPEPQLVSQRSIERANDKITIRDDDSLDKLVQTSMVISEQGAMVRKVSSSSSKRYGSQDNILPVEDLGALVTTQHNIPMMPLRARTKEKILN